MIKQIRTDKGETFWEYYDDDTADFVASIRKTKKYGRKYSVNMEDRYKFAHKSKKNCVAHIELILRARSQMINKNEHAL